MIQCVQDPVRNPPWWWLLRLLCACRRFLSGVAQISGFGFSPKYVLAFSYAHEARQRDTNFEKRPVNISRYQLRGDADVYFVYPFTFPAAATTRTVASKIEAETGLAG